ncbi:MAG: bifunctional nuclease family protein [Deferribacterales bacterium]
MYEVTVYKVVKEPLTSRYIMMLDPVDKAESSVLIPIGKKEAENIHSRKCEAGKCTSSAYDILTPIMNSLKSVTFDKLLIEDCECGRFTAGLYMTVSGSEKVLDCRPSDGVVLALDRNIPIYIKRVTTCCTDDE